MMSRSWTMPVSHLVGLFLLVAAGLPFSAPALAQTFDWLESTGPEGGQVYSLAQAPNGDLYAGCWNRGGVYRSTDEGLTWQETGLGYEQVHSLVVNNAGAVFAALSNGEIHRSQDNGASWPSVQGNLVNGFGAMAYDPDLDILYAGRAELFSRSIDGGEIWEPIGPDFPYSQVNCLAAVPNGGPLFAGTESDMVFRSDDGGATWDSFTTGMTTGRILDFLVVPEGDIYAASYGTGIYRAAIDGTSWTQLRNGLDDSFCTAIGRDSNGSLWTGTISSGTYVSHNGGLIWEPARTGIELREMHDLLFLGGGEFLAATDGGGVFRTANFGDTWTSSNTGMNRCIIFSIALAGTGNLYAGARGGGVHRSTDGGVTWEPVNDGIGDPNVYDVVSHPDGDLFCGTWTTQIYQSTNDGDSWVPTATAPGMERVASLAVHPVTGELYAGALFAGGVWRSPDKGATWFPANDGLPDEKVADLVVEDDGDLLAGLDGGGVFRSQDNGDSWSALNNGLPGLFVSEVLSLPGGVLFAAIPYFGLYRSLDDGANWDRVDASLNDTRIRSVTVNPNGFLFAGASVGGLVFQSIDGGDTWFQIWGMAAHVPVQTLAFNEDGNLLAGTNGFSGFYTDQTTPVFLQEFVAVRLEGGPVTVSWYLPTDVPHLSGEIFRSVAGSERVQLSSDVLTGGPGFEFVDLTAPDEACDYWLRLTDALGTQSWYGPVSVDKVDLVIAGLAIEAVWPNPAPQTTTIRYSVPANQAASLDVYDLRGRLVRRLRQEAGGSGTLEAVWDARDDRGSRVAAGTYFLRLSTESKVVTGKVVVIGNQR